MNKDEEFALLGSMSRIATSLEQIAAILKSWTASCEEYRDPTDKGLRVVKEST